MASQQQQFEQLLQNLMSSENDVRGQAERILNQTKVTQPNDVIQALLQVGRTSATPELRSFAFILLRRSLVNTQDKSLWPKLNGPIQGLLKREFLNGLEREEDKHVLSSLRDLTSDLAAQLLEDGSDQWNELLEWIIRTAQSPSPGHRQSVLSILSSLSVFLAESFHDKFAVIKAILQAGLGDADLQVRLSALYAVVSFVQVITQAPLRKELQSLLPAMLDVLAWTLNNKDEESAQTALKHFIDLGELDPGFIKQASPLVMDAMLKIAQATELDDSTRQLALEFLVTFVENKPTLCKQIPGLVQNLVNLLLQLMLDMEETSLEEWNLTEDNDENSELQNSLVAQEDLDRICLALRGDNIVPVIFEHIPKLLANKDNWQFRHVGLMALSMIGEGCRDFLKPHLDKLVAMVLPLFSDDHPRVRWAAANAAGQMSTDFGPKFQKQFHSEVLPRFVKLLDDAKNPKVQAHTAAATINFCEKFESNLLTPYLNDILSKLIVLVKSGRRQVQEQAVTAVASIAGCAGKGFIPFYPSFVPLLKEILVSVQTKEYRMLRAKAMECVSLIGIAVGKEKFKEDAVAIMEILAATQSANLDPDDPQREFMLQAWTRISTCLGEDFVPYLKFVMPPLLKSASLNAGVHVLDNEDDQEGEQGWEYVNVGDAKIAIHTSALEEKAGACNMLYCYASEMRDGFFPWVEEVSKICVPLLTFYYHDGVRLASLSIMAMLLQSAKLFLEKNNQDKKKLNDLFAYIYPNLIEAVASESDQEVLVVGIEAIHQVIDQMGPNCLSPEAVKDLMHQIKVLIVAMQQRRSEIVGRNPDGDVDDSFVIREELTKEDDIANELAEVVGVLVKNHPHAFLSNFQELFVTTMDMIQKNRAPSERQLALCIFDDITEHTQQHSIPLFQHFLPFMLEYALDPHPGVRQAACFGLGVCAQYGGEAFKPFTRQTLELLVNMITHPDSRTDKNAPPTENAISSVGKIIQFQSAVIQEKLSEIMDMWLSWLPITVDLVEAKVVHEQLVNFIKTMNNIVFGKDFKNLPKILTVFADIVQIEPSDPVVVTQSTRNDIIHILSSMQQQFPGQLLQQAFMVLPAHQQARLQKIMSAKPQ